MLTVPKGLGRWNSKISDIMVDGDGSYNVGLKRGWICELTETHQVYEGSLKEVVRVFNAGWVKLCECADCKGENQLKMTERINVQMDKPMLAKVEKLAARLHKKTGVEHTLPDAIRWALQQVKA